MSPPPAHGFAAAWLAREPRATALVPSPDDIERRRATVRRAADRRVSSALLEVLASQNAALPDIRPDGMGVDRARARSLEALARGGAAVVVTGQQVGLFGGPLYSIYKAVSAVQAARALSRESGVPVVPLFWLQTEDHDFPEVAECFLPRPGEPTALRLAIGGGGVEGRVSVAERVLGDDVTTRIDEAAAVISSLPAGSEALSALRDSYRPGVPLAAAFARLMARLFADTGLLFFDPRPPGDARVSSLLSPFYERALSEAGPLSELLTGRGDWLSAEGFEAQVHVRPGSPLLFLHVPDERGGRYRLDPVAPDADRFLLVGDPQRTEVTQAELQRVAREAPRRLSTSALVRPIAQDVLLPTCACVGGPGEVAYFAQLMPLYPRFDLPAPLVLHRARFRCTPARTGALLDELGLLPSDTTRPREALLSELAGRRGALISNDLAPPEELRAALVEAAARVLDPLTAPRVQLEPQLHKALLRTRATIERAADRFTARYARSLRERDHVTTARLDRVLAALQPNGEPQERVFAIPWLVAHLGAERLAPTLLEALGSPFDASLREVRL